ncbi:CRISPR-associated protein Cas4 [Spirochaetota bacterium]
MQYNEEELIPISALQHMFFCHRQYALIYIEQIWEENLFTAEGKVIHERVHSEHRASRRLFKQEYSMSVRSLVHGLIGKCDLVEIYLSPDKNIAEAVPIEFKRGSEKGTDVDRVQLCAQAFCLEEMLGITVPFGQFYYFKDHRRSNCDIDLNLRETTKNIIKKIRTLEAAQETPAAIYSKKKCDNCSLVEICMPKSAGSGAKRVERYVQAQIKALERIEGKI